ncbi:MAG: flagellar hook capping FlgD N-terminal domain-containing protein, partial [Planctomycetia bacterium]
ASNPNAETSSAEVTSSGYDAFNDVGVEEFFKLMTTELQNQDPLDPMDNAEMLSQISQIRDIVASDNLTNTLSTITSTFESVMLGQNMATASGMIGQTIEATDNDDITFTGEVAQVTITDGIPTLKCNEVVPEQTDENGDVIPEHTVEHLVSLENITSIVPAGTKPLTSAEISEQMSKASALIGKNIVAEEGEIIAVVTDEDGNVTETREAIDSSVVGTVEKTMIDDGEVKVMMRIPAGEPTDDNQDPQDQHILVSLTDVKQVLPETEKVDPSKLTEELAVASSMVGRNVIGNVTGTDGEAGQLGGLVQYAYIEDGQTMLAVQPPNSEDNENPSLYALALSEVTNVYGYDTGTSNDDT